jgi:hypothetical protein
VPSAAPPSACSIAARDIDDLPLGDFAAGAAGQIACGNGVELASFLSGRSECTLSLERVPERLRSRRLTRALLSCELFANADRGRLTQFLFVRDYHDWLWSFYSQKLKTARQLPRRRRREAAAAPPGADHARGHDRTPQP